jgi:uncharacterized linocin/CFP29 family protein
VNNLHRELAPISDAAWTDLEREKGRTFQHLVAELSAVTTGHLDAMNPN